MASFDPAGVFPDGKNNPVIMFLLNLLFITNLLYFRTYFSAIPLASYGLAGNLEDFKSSVYASLRWYDAVFLMTTLFPLFLWRKKYKEPAAPITGSAMLSSTRYLVLPAILLLWLTLSIQRKGGFHQVYNRHERSRLFASRPPIYTLFGSLYYDYLQGKEKFTPEINREIESWLAEKPAYRQIPFHIIPRRNCIIILAESLESWVLEQEFEDKEITPYLNKLLKDSTVLYAPYVQSQVKGGRSIDGQLLLNTGLLPVASGAFSARFPHNHYPALVTAFKEKHPDTKAYSVTVDRQIVWNQCVVAPAFGYDGLIDRNSFVIEEKVGPRKQLGDISFFRQVGQKIENGELWDDSRPDFLQLVTYSGHFPFVLPEEMKRISFSHQAPAMMNDYMTMANYTDYAIGEFIENLKRQDRYKNTMIVITGDHEGLADHRDDIIKSEAGRRLVSPYRFVPFIVLNSPVSLRYDKVMGQVDIYPTLLDLLGLDEYPWRGIGSSILHKEKPGYAVDAEMQVIGKVPEGDKKGVEHLKKAWEISDYMIRYDYFRNYFFPLTENREH